MTTSNLSVSGMTCASCAISLESYLKKQPGISDAIVSYAASSVKVKYQEDLVDVAQIQQYAQALGYDIIDSIDKQKGIPSQNIEHKSLAILERNLVISSMLTLPVFIISMFLYDQVPYSNHVLFFLATPVLCWSGRVFFTNAWKRLRHGTSNMDTLVALSTGTAFLFSTIVTFFPNHFLEIGLEKAVFFESAVVIITLILLGRYLEERGKLKTADAVKGLMKLQPRFVSTIINGEEKQLEIEDVRKGDLILVKPGEYIPLDCKVKKGESHVDESSITGESKPLRKSKGDFVHAGTINQKGSLRLIVKKAKGETLLDEIIETVREAQSSKPDIQKLVDRIAGVFVPIVFFLSLLTFVIWYSFGPDPRLMYAIFTFITVLIIACPCALGLATPTAVMVGIGKGARSGMLIKKAEVLEQLSKCNTIVMDKTGTITKGELTVTDEEWYAPRSSRTVLSSLEMNSEHPIASAIYTFYKTEADAIEIQDFQSLTGKGLKGAHGEETFFIGNKALMDAEGIGLDMIDEELTNSWYQSGKTVVYFASEERLIATIAVADTLRNTAEDSILEMKKHGLDVHIVTGDHTVTAQSIADQVGVENLLAEALPTEKIDYIRALQMQGRKVAMVGDGINDAGALAQADVGIAMGGGTAIAIDSAGLVLMNADLGLVIKAVDLSKRTVSTIRQNLFWAFGYNIIAIPIAAGLLYPFFGVLLSPMIAGGAMAFSSVSVVINSLRLRN